MISSPELAVHSGPTPRNAPSPISVAVGHRSALVAAGLAATLARMPQYDVRLWQIPEFECDSRCDHDDAELIFGDSILLKRLREESSEPGKFCSLASAKFVWVTTGDEASAHAAKAAGEIDEHLPLRHSCRCCTVRAPATWQGLKCLGRTKMDESSKECVKPEIRRNPLRLIIVSAH